mmetsp:Transcript_30928/g.44436  ORF Transcript_30928/g.44436 Transcript_30928/m.44436 type:complete len:194 (+) Transcript_30928:345-926(+)
MPYVQCKLVDPETETDVLHPNQPGEIRVTGPCVFKHYINLPEATAECFDKQGWFKTGDIAERTVDGFYKILGRQSSDIIKSSGYKLSALEIERELLGHPLIAEAVVVGKNDPAAGEKIVAIITLRDEATSQDVFKIQMDEEAAISNAKMLKSFLADRLSYYKNPKEVYVVDFIPRNHMGKVNKKSILQTLGLL